ncbi:carbon-nitrogen hydrolase family protein [Litoribacillus peritrichatus]|uniref:Carbon-nitrogen hydrolase family protein n=1 Tax=Litoribacillus peritrichatus TaxID=718191 RepID=A0ABP7M9E4_9GAMM
MKASVIQMVSTSDTEENLSKASELLRTAKSQGAEIAVLPEMFAHFGEKDAQEFASQWTQADGPVRTWLKSLCEELDLWVIAGTLPVLDSDQQAKPTATCLIVDNQGNEHDRYDKVHLFDVDVSDKQGAYRESNFYQAGTQTCVADTPLGKLGMAICYDLRFPELFRNLVDQGATLFAIPSAFTYQTGSAHWLPLLQARAIENQCFVLAANQGGEHSETRRTWGQSCIIDPWGKVLGEIAEGEGVLTIDLPLEETRAIRANIPCLNNRMDWL